MSGPALARGEVSLVLVGIWVKAADGKERGGSGSKLSNENDSNRGMKDGRMLVSTISSPLKMDCLRGLEAPGRGVATFRSPLKARAVRTSPSLNIEE